MLPYHRKLLSAVGGGFSVQAVTFDGSNDYLSLGSDLTGNTDGKQGTFSCWIKFDDSGTDVKIYDGGGGGIFVDRIGSSDKISVDFGGGFSVNTVNAYNNTDGWINILSSWNAAATTGHLYINDVQDEDNLSSLNTNINYTQSNHYIAASGGSDKLDGDLAEVYINFSDYIDLSITANRRKFIDADGKPVNLGSNGSIPTGNQPIIYLSGNASSFASNKGTGGGFTVNGSLTDALTSPSD